MQKRILFGGLMLLVTAGLLWLDHHLQNAGGPVIGVPLAAAAALLVIAGTIEFARLADGVGLPVLRGPGIVCALAITTLPVWRQAIGLAGPLGKDLPLLTAAGVVIVTFLSQMAGHRTDRAVRRIASTLTAVMYLAVPAACMLALRIRFGVGALVVFLAAVKFTDIGAYFTGTMIGRHKIIPWLSPGKSWEGLFGGLAAAVVVTLVLSRVLAGAVAMSVWQAVLFAVVMALAGQFGDLCESLLKRDAKLKDAGAVVPEFGGVLDIVDSPLIAAPVAYGMLALMS